MTLNSQQKSNENSIYSTASGRSLKTVKRKVKEKLTQTMKNSLRGINDPYLKSFQDDNCHAAALNSMAYCEREVIEKILQETSKKGITPGIARKYGMFNITYYRNISSRRPVEEKESTENGDHIWTNESMAEFILKLIEAGTPNVLDNRKQSKTNCLILWLYYSLNNKPGAHAVNICRDENGKLVLIDTSYHLLNEYKKVFKKSAVYYKDLKAIKYLEKYNQNFFSLITTKEEKYNKNFKINRDRISDFKMGTTKEEILLSDYLKILKKYEKTPYNLKEMFNPTIDGIKPLKLVGKNGKLHKSWPKHIRSQFNLPLTLSKLSDTDMLSLEDLDEIFNHNQTTPSPSKNLLTQLQIQSQTQPSPSINSERQTQSQTQSQSQSQSQSRTQSQLSPTNNSERQSQIQSQIQSQLSPTNNSERQSQIQSQTQPSPTRKIKKRRSRKKRSIFRGRKR
jgi:hypothetical protein